MTPLLYRLGGFCVRRRWIVVAVWLVIFAGLAVAARSVGPDLNDNLTLPGTDSQRATDLLAERFPSQANGTNPVVLQAPRARSSPTPSTRSRSTTRSRRSRRIPTSAARRARSPPRTSSPRTSGPATSRSTCAPSPSDLTTDDAQRIVDEADPARDAGLAVSFGGYVGQKVSKPETHSSEAVGLAMAVIVLLLTFGTVVAMGLPIVTAIVGLVSGLSIITLISQVAEVPTVAPTLATMIGLGVGIDYALFIVTRHQAQRRAGMETRESIARSAATSGGAVVFAGTTVIVALLSLAVVDIPLVTTLGYTSALVVLVAVIAAITLLPAILAIVGDRIDRLALPHRRGVKDDHPHGWERWARFVARRPLPSALVAVVVLVALALPTLDLYLGQQDNGALPTSTEARRAYDGLTASFGVGANGPLLVSVDMSQAAGEARPGEARRPQPAGVPAEGGGAREGRGAGPAAVGGRRAGQADRGQGRRPAQEAREQGDRPAADAPARRPHEDGRREQGHAAAGQLAGHRRRPQRDADDRARRTRPPSSSCGACATTRSRARRRART